MMHASNKIDFLPDLFRWLVVRVASHRSREEAERWPSSFKDTCLLTDWDTSRIAFALNHWSRTCTIYL